jgi:acetyl-CoA carboxylase biotin carboxyl carrier protein
MDIKQVEKLITIIDKSNIQEIEVKNYYNLIHVVTNKKNDLYQKKTKKTPNEIALKEVVNRNEKVNTLLQLSSEKKEYIKSPMVGTFYRSLSPKSKPFVTEGQSVSIGDVLCIIEAMKIMNKIETDIEGKISKIMVNDGDNIEYDQPLFIIDK